MNLSASLVLFHNDPTQYGQAMRCFLEGCDGVLYVVDNSMVPLQHELFAHPRVRYVHAGDNLGFGKAHNRAIAMAAGTSDAHLLLNPDISFEPHVLPELGRFLKANQEVGAVMPRITYPDGSLQRLCKLLPTPVDLILRRFIPSERIKAKINQRYEMHGLTQDRPSRVPTLSGCFLLIRSDLLHRMGGFDERFFMYMEDVDLVRRIGDVAETVYLPSVQVVHAYAKGSYRNRKLLGYHLRSAVLYFSKWGWWLDRTRRERNRKALRLVQSGTQAAAKHAAP
ncbi:glycosyltransferase family 2 protein [Hydrogenophaga sp.]|uniref:glycosyltransferase family 2 protein n=1 Tax=Hydrogenophaga sp. TaxID=1904254 RepID=UPI00286E804B|nr:glycosyltransferase family 2 protein [Hydrogenophaga sp.]